VWHALLEFLYDSTGGYAVKGDPAPHGPGAQARFRLGDWDLVERTITLEPPWRRVYEIIEGAPCVLYQGTTTLRDDDAECHLVWSYLAEPITIVDEASGHASPTADSEAFLERAKTAITTAADLVVARVNRADH